MNVKKYLENLFRGWLPKEPDANSIKRTMSRRTLGNKPVLGIVLVSLAVTLLLFFLIIATRTDTVINTSFVLEPNEKIVPYENGTYYHTHIISESTLMMKFWSKVKASTLQQTAINTALEEQHN